MRIAISKNYFKNFFPHPKAPSTKRGLSPKATGGAPVAANQRLPPSGGSCRGKAVTERGPLGIAPHPKAPSTKRGLSALRADWGSPRRSQPKAPPSGGELSRQSRD